VLWIALQKWIALREFIALRGLIALQKWIALQFLAEGGGATPLTIFWGQTGLFQEDWEM
jgi:hypothetical protein